MSLCSDLNDLFEGQYHFLQSNAEDEMQGEVTSAISASEYRKLYEIQNFKDVRVCSLSEKMGQIHLFVESG